MKNVTIALDDETHRRARIRAAEMGTSLSAMVKDFFERLDDETPPSAFREMPMTYHALPLKVPGPKKARQPGGLRGKIGMADDFNTWPDDVLASFDAWDDSDGKA